VDSARQTGERLAGKARSRLEDAADELPDAESAKDAAKSKLNSARQSGERAVGKARSRIE